MTILFGALICIGFTLVVLGFFGWLIFGSTTMLIAGVVMIIIGFVGALIAAGVQASAEQKADNERRRVQRMQEEKSRRERNAFMQNQSKFLAEGNKVTMDGHTFEEYCAYLLKKNGYSSASVTRGSGDHGADIIAKKDGLSYAIQCKKYAKPVGNRAVQEALMGKMYYKTDYAVVMTDSSFTPQAIEDANVADVRLWDKRDLMELARKA